MEESLVKTEEIVLNFQKDLIYEVVTNQFSDQYIKRQKRLNNIISPFKKAREILQDMLGENIEKIETEDYIDMTPVEIEKKKSKKIISHLSYEESVKYLFDAKKHGLKQTNSKKEN